MKLHRPLAAALAVTAVAAVTAGPGTSPASAAPAETCIDLPFVGTTCIPDFPTPDPILQTPQDAINQPCFACQVIDQNQPAIPATPATPAAPAAAPLAPPVVPVLSVDGDRVTEGDAGSREAQVEFTLSAPTTVTVSATYHSEDKTAQDGSDYSGHGGTVSFAPGETSKTASFSVHGDTLHEADERFDVEISNVTNATTGDEEDGDVHILNDDAAPAVTIDDTRTAEGDQARFRVVLSAPSALPATVSVATANGTALAGRDYSARSGVLTFAPGETAKELAVPTTDDTDHEPTETFAAALSGASEASIGRAQGTAAITDDDPVKQTAKGDAPSSSSTGAAGAAPAQRSEPVPLVGSSALRGSFEGITGRGRVLLTLSCPAGPAACTGTLRLVTSDSLIVGQSPYRLAPGTEAELSIALSRAARRALGRRHRLRLKVRSSAGTLGSFVALNPQPLPPKQGKHRRHRKHRKH